MSLPVIVMAKAPVPGTVKTRLAASLGAEAACDLYRRLLRHTLANAAAYTEQLHLHVSPDAEHPELQALAAEFNAQLSVQCQGDLGARMQHAFTQLGTPALLIGSDCPFLDAEQLRRAEHSLRHSDITLTPSDDGGYVLIGLNRVHAAPFTDIAWSTPQVLAQSQRACQHHGLSLTLNPSLWDIDDGADLQRLRALQKFDSLVAECP